MDAVKDEQKEHPIAISWRPTIAKVVEVFSRGDFALSERLENVHLIPGDISAANKSYVEEYGEVLIALPDETWESSCAQWMGTHWDIIVDLFTESEGRSDLVLTGRVTEKNGSVKFQFGLIYVP